MGKKTKPSAHIKTTRQGDARSDYDIVSDWPVLGAQEV